MIEELKRCPFCGGTDLFVDPGEYRQKYEIKCMTCGGRVGYFATYQEAIDA